MQPISQRWIKYLLEGDSPKQTIIADSINAKFPPSSENKRGVVRQSDITRWCKTIPKNRIEHLGALVDEQIWSNLRCEREPVYLCNISETYGRDRQRSARRQLQRVLRHLLPQKIAPDTFALYIVPTRLPRGIHAQTFANNSLAPCVFIILVEESRKAKSAQPISTGTSVDPIDLTAKQQDYVMKELAEHVFNGRVYLRVSLTDN